jgi:hypothetical protein
MMHKPISKPWLGALAIIANLAFTAVIDSYPTPAWGQTAGMTRREDRRATRREARDVKHECNASGQGTRAECRAEKHGVKEQGRSDRTGSTTTTNVTPQTSN